MAAGALSEASAQSFWRQLVGAVDYMHSEGVCHRDIS
jgi:serine/threonine protein kinase